MKIGETVYYVERNDWRKQGVATHITLSVKSVRVVSFDLEDVCVANRNGKVEFHVKKDLFTSKVDLQKAIHAQKEQLTEAGCTVDVYGAV